MRNKKTDFTSKAKDLMNKGKKYAKGNTEELITVERVKFSKAYAKLSRTTKTCDAWVDALLAEGANDEIIAPFLQRAVELTPVVTEPVTPELEGSELTIA